MKTLKKTIALTLCILLALFLFVALMGNAPAKTKAAAEAMEDETEIADDAMDETDLKTAFDSLITQMKAKYGDQYEEYLQLVLTEWGSIESDILAKLGDDPAASGWKRALSWLHENSPIWASALAIVLVAVSLICGGKAVKKIFTWLTEKKTVVFKGMNKLYEAQYAQGQALLKLLGDTPRTAEERAAITASMEKLKEEDDV